MAIAGWQVVITLEGNDAFKTVFGVLAPFVEKVTPNWEARPFFDSEESARQAAQAIQNAVDAGRLKRVNGLLWPTEPGERLYKDEARARFFLLVESH
jgi:hypothetical protein